MLTVQFIEQNLHFAISLFAALVFFAVFWLYFDAWIGQNSKHKKDAVKWLGFLLVALSFIPNATLVEQSDLGTSIFGNAAAVIAPIIRIIGYALIIVGQVVDPLQPVPVNKGLDETLGISSKHAAPAALAAGSLSQTIALALLPLQALAIAALYWRRATTGLERHLKPVALAFLLLFIFELLSAAELFRSTNNPALYDLVKAFGPIWIAAQLFLLAAIMAMGKWVWHYLTERFFSQLFMTFIAVVLGVFVITTVSFTFLLLRNIQDNALNNLATATSVLNYALDSKKSTAQANAEAEAASPGIVQAIVAKDHKSLIQQTGAFLASKQEASLVVTTAEGQVLLRAEDPDRWGDSISSDTLLRRALIGHSSTTVETQSSVLAPVVTIRAIVPARDSSGTIIGTVSVSTVINNAFLDGVKHSTGLDSAIYSKDVRSATTFTAPDGISRWVGVKETDSGVTSAVLQHGQVFKSELAVLNRDYLAVYAPLKDADNTIIGMLFIGQPEFEVLQTTSYLITLTFVVAAALLVLSIIPAYIVARYIAKQLE